MESSAEDTVACEVRGQRKQRGEVLPADLVRHVNAKMDLLLTHPWRRLMEIQPIQMDLMEELVERRPK